MINILIISYGIKEYDGRLKELYNACKTVGKTTLLSCGLEESENENEEIIQLNGREYLSKNLYFEFFFKALKKAILVRNDIDIILIDNMFASIPGIIFKFFFRKKFLVQDVRELYFVETSKSYSEKLFVFFEAKLMKQSNLVISANSERAQIMRDKYSLKKLPITYENIRVLDGSYDEEELENKYKGWFTSKYNILSTGGLSIKRGTDKLILAMKKLSDEYKLYVVGSGTDEDKSIINNKLEQNDINNVVLIDRVPLNELKYIVKKCQIGIVNYHQNDLNNQYCASGKIYEYIAEGLPIVTTENIPLMNFCRITGTGEADNEFYKGIIKVSQNYDFYKEKVAIFLEQFSVEKNNEKLASKILDEYKKINNGRR